MISLRKSGAFYLADGLFTFHFIAHIYTRYPCIGRDIAYIRRRSFALLGHAIIELESGRVIKAS